MISFSANQVIHLLVFFLQIANWENFVDLCVPNIFYDFISEFAVCGNLVTQMCCLCIDLLR